MRTGSKVVLGGIALLAVGGGGYAAYEYSEKKADPKQEATTMDAVPHADDVKAFEEFEIKYNRVYKSEQERMNAFKVFVMNKKTIDTFNAKNSKTKLAINEFADVHPETFKSNKLGLKMPSNTFGQVMKKRDTFKATGMKVPASLDWRSQGAVTPVKNQAQCGSCWSFSTTGALEGRWQVATGKLCSLSEQQFVDCDDQNDHGCEGGLMDNAFSFAESHALCSEDSFPYTAKDGECPADIESTCDVCIPNGSVTSFTDVTPNDVDAMKEAMQGGPISVAIEADQAVFQFYKEGVVTSAECGEMLDHGVLAVGYGTEDDGTGYFLVKNSWGNTWGSDGYVKIASALTADGESECGILSQASFPVVSQEKGQTVQAQQQLFV